MHESHRVTLFGSALLVQLKFSQGVAASGIASYPGIQGGGGRMPGNYFLHMRVIRSLILCNIGDDLQWVGF
jgi:hypothetical protein